MSKAVISPGEPEELSAEWQNLFLMYLYNTSKYLQWIYFQLGLNPPGNSKFITSVVCKIPSLYLISASFQTRWYLEFMAYYIIVTYHHTYCVLPWL